MLTKSQGGRKKRTQAKRDVWTIGRMVHTVRAFSGLSGATIRPDHDLPTRAIKKTIACVQTFLVQKSPMGTSNPTEVAKKILTVHVWRRLI